MGHREHQRRYREANREKIAERQRRYSEANREKLREKNRQYRRTISAKLGQLGRRHGAGVLAWFAETWEAQQGLCYLCALPLLREEAVIDHDHTCCEYGKTCTRCRRGLAHTNCNVLIGHAGDDPDLLRTIASNLELVRAVTRKRIAARPTQGALL